jgi:UDP-2-acetamido-2,6-beta-L-arabino-hexul-4-ose reductase
MWNRKSDYATKPLDGITNLKRILLTGANGFIGKNLALCLSELKGFSVVPYVRGSAINQLPQLIAQTDVIVHLAGENRPQDEKAFEQVNTGLTKALCEAIQHETKTTGRKVSLILASSTQAERNNPYGQSKLAAEQAVQAMANATGNPAVVFRLPGVFGKWCKPNYNSVVATFCHNIARGLPIQVNDPTALLRLVYIDDVVSCFLQAIEQAIESTEQGFQHAAVQPEYSTTLGQLASQIEAFKNCRTTLLSERVGTGLVRALYSTYVSYLPAENFSYTVPQHGDPRGVFVEMLKTPDCGQFSYFTAHPGITRGGHYHHSKTEKFLVIKGQARFKFRHMHTSECHELITSGDKAEVVETVPGWTHDITNIGEDEMVVMLWANEIFDREKPDTLNCPL